MPESLACVNVGKVYFNERDSAPGKSVANCHAGVGIRGRVDYNKARALASGLLDSIHQSPFMIALETLNLDAGTFCGLDQPAINLFDCFSTVDFRFANAKQIQVRSV